MSETRCSPGGVDGMAPADVDPADWCQDACDVVTACELPRTTAPSLVLRRGAHAPGPASWIERPQLVEQIPLFRDIGPSPCRLCPDRVFSSPVCVSEAPPFPALYCCLVLGTWRGQGRDSFARPRLCGFSA